LQHGGKFDTRAVASSGQRQWVKYFCETKFWPMGTHGPRKKIMPKMKTHSGAAKRFKKTGTGKIKRAMAYKRHILTSKDTKRKRQLGGTTLVSDADHAKVARMIPY